MFTLGRLNSSAHGNLTRFIGVGTTFTQPGKTPIGITIASGSGYDGQFYYRLALDPFDLRHTAYGITFDNAYRVQRITYSLLVWLAAGGRHGLVPLSLVLVNVLALAVLAGVSAQLAYQCNRHPAYGLLVAGYFGFLFTLGRDLTEICEVLFVLVGLLLLRSQRPVWAAVALSAAVLSRVTAFVVGGGLAFAGVIAFAGGDRPGQTDVAWLLPALAYVGWEFVGWSLYGAVPLRTDTTNNITAPF